LIVESPFDRFSNTVGNRFRAFGVPAELATSLLVFWGSVQSGANGFAHNPSEYADAVTCPTLILHGAQDPRVTVAQVSSLRDGFTPAATLVLVPGAGHESLIGFAPREWRDAVAEFLPRVSATP
jgi:pimeloyl-ACP methyl ester carboxylesterase